MIYDPHKNGKPSTLPVSPIFVLFLSHFLSRLCPDFNINTRISYTLVFRLFSCTYKLYFYTRIVPYETFIALFVNLMGYLQFAKRIVMPLYSQIARVQYGFNQTDHIVPHGDVVTPHWVYRMRGHTLSYPRISPRKGCAVRFNKLPRPLSRHTITTSNQPYGFTTLIGTESA